MTRTRVALLAVAVLSLAACGKKTASVSGPPPPPPPIVSAVSPTHQSVAIPVFDPEIWAEFTEPLDPATVSDRSVFLKIDDGRIPITVTYDATRRRIVIHPVSSLERLTNYTVELSTNLRTESGGGFERTWFWQFTTFAIRPPDAPTPASGAVDRSLFAPLTWGGNADSPGGARYEIYAGVDSAAVASHAMPAISTGELAHYIPRQSWAQGTAVYWSVRAISLATGEHLDSPVWNFSTRDPAGAVIDSVSLIASEGGHQSLVNRNIRGCLGLSVWCGPSYWCAMRWNVALIPQDAHIANVRIQLRAASGYENVVPAGTTVWGATVQVAACNLFEAPPRFDEPLGPLAHARAVGNATVVLQSDLLAAHVEAMRQYPGAFFGHLFRGTTDLLWWSNNSTDAANRPRMIVYYYR